MIQEVLLIVGPVVTGFVTWFFARRKMGAEATGAELKNSALICEMWKNLSEGMEKRFKVEIDELRKLNCDLENQVKAVVRENVALKERMKELEEENIKLIRQLKILNPNNQ
jgi:hypothetical protein